LPSAAGRLRDLPDPGHQRQTEANDHHVECRVAPENVGAKYEILMEGLETTKGL
jgi:hypothetical protein